jgi:hypothetical protein
MNTWEISVHGIWGKFFLSNRKRGNCERKKEERGQKNGNYQLNGETNAKLGK